MITIGYDSQALKCNRNAIEMQFTRYDDKIWFDTIWFTRYDDIQSEVDIRFLHSRISCMKLVDKYFKVCYNSTIKYKPRNEAGKGSGIWFLSL